MDNAFDFQYIFVTVVSNAFFYQSMLTEFMPVQILMTKVTFYLEHVCVCRFSCIHAVF